jgi:hypothetical protein
MPFTGSGTGIQNANDVFFSGISSGNILRYNSATAKWNNTALSVTASELVDGSITEPKLAISNSPSNNQLLRWNGAALEWATLSYEASIAAGTTAQYFRGDKSWQTLDKTVIGLANVDNTADVSKNVLSATKLTIARTINGVSFDGSANITITDATKAAVTTSVTGLNSVSGGGDLSVNRTLSLVNDSAVPGNSMYYGTNASGTKGFYAIPAGDPAVGGDLSGTASNAQIAASAVGTNELAALGVTTAKIADSAITEPKLAMTNSPSNGQVISWNGTGLAWAGSPAYTKVSVASDYTVPSGFHYVFVDATAGGVTVTLPAPVLNTYVRIKRMSSGANSVQVVAPNGSYIDASGVGSDVIGNQYDSREYWSDGTNWYR